MKKTIETVRKRFPCLMMPLIILLAAMLFRTPVFADGLAGAGTAEDPYRITNALDLAAFRDLVNAEDACAAHAVLTENIDLNDEEWIPINSKSGYPTTAYEGVFDGAGHTIAGLSVNGSTANQGLFAVINGAEIKNLSVVGNVRSTKAYVGGIVGKIQQGRVINCSFSGTVGTSATGSSAYAGGITGYAGNTAAQTAVIRGSMSCATVTGGVTGGIAGYIKYTSITDCYSTGTVIGTNRSGGIAGQMQNNASAENCYSIASVGGSTTAADICDFLYASATLKNCWYPTKLFGAGAGTDEGCGMIASPDALLSALGGAYVSDSADQNGGYPILAWQSAGELPSKEPKLSIAGGTVLYQSNGGEQPRTTLEAVFSDAEPSLVVWSVDGDGVLMTEAPADPDENNTKLIVTALAPGTAFVTATASDGALTARQKITVMPFVTAVEIDGLPVAGEEISAKVYVLGGGEYDDENEDFPPLDFRWRYLTSEDYAAGNTGTSFYRDIEGAAGRTIIVPRGLAGDYLTVSLWYHGEMILPRGPVKIYSEEYPALIRDGDALKIDTADRKECGTVFLPERSEHGYPIFWRSSHPEVIDPKSGKVVLPSETTVDVTLSAALKNGFDETYSRSFVIRVYSEQALEEEKTDQAQKMLEDAVAKLGGFYKITPVFGTDTNVLSRLRADLEKRGVDCEGIDFSIRSTETRYGGADIAADGTITYFYADPNTTPAIKFGSFLVTFTLRAGGASVDLDVPVIVYWDADKVKATMKEEILDRVTGESLLNGNTSLDYVTGDLLLPKVVDRKKWTLVSWQSSDNGVISVSSRLQTSADTLFEPYVGVVRRASVDKHVTLTATFTFMFTNNPSGSEAPIVMNKVFDVTVKALGSEEREAAVRALEEKLDAGFEKAGLTDAVTGEMLTEQNGRRVAFHDIQLPTTRDFGVDGKYFPVTLASSDESVLATPGVRNAARVSVIRPAPGKADAAVSLTVTLTDTEKNLSASKTFEILVPAISDAEISTELSLMQRVQASYFDGIKGENARAENVRTDLCPFLEVYEEDGSLVWVRKSDEITNHGIVPEPLEGWEELEAWRLFRSSSPASVAHETLRVTRQKNAKAVTVSSALSSETLGKYGALYQSDPETYSDYAPLSALYNQPVSASVVVRGLSTAPNVLNPVAVEEKITVYFRMQSSDRTLIETTAYRKIDETLTVFDIFDRALTENDYRYQKRGSYVYSITAPDGTTYSSKDEGENSGWMYQVNGVVPEVYMGACGLKDGDEILVYFTKDYLNGAYPQPGGTSPAGGVPAAGIPKIKDETPSKPQETAAQSKSGIASSFSDVAGHWAEDAIRFVVERKLMLGVRDDTFAPDAPVTRAMFVTLLYRTEHAENESIDAGKKPFEDVAAGSWYENAVVWASGAGIVKGVSETEFLPDAEITREEIAALLHRYASYLSGNSAEESLPPLSFDDEDSISDWARTDVRYAVGHGLMRGKDGNLFCPNDAATRAEAAVTLQRLISPADES